MPPRFIPFSVIALLFAVLPATALESVEVLEADGRLWQHLWVAPSPTPGTCYWELAEGGGPVFHATNADGDGTLECSDPWIVHCDSDSLVFRGVWPFIDATYVTGSEYLVDLSCSVNITADTRVSAGRTVVGNLDTDEHTLTITYPDGSILPVLPSGSGPDQAQVILQPGVYLVTLQVSAYQHKVGDEIIEPYLGHVLLRWEDPGSVAVEPVSWSSLKALFER
jgi:hypothetical protein